MLPGVCHSLSMAILVKHCGGAEHTLNEPFRVFVGLSPIGYHRRVRLAAARDALLTGGSGTSVTEVARRYRFNHAGRFSEQYRKYVGESPSATLRRAQAAALSQPAGVRKGNRRRKSIVGGKGVSVRDKIGG